MTQPDFPRFATRCKRRWGIYGRATAGKSTFLSAMRQPLLVADPDGRFEDTALLCKDALSISENPQDHRDPLAIYRILRERECRGIGTVCLDSLTAILEPLKAAIMEENRRGEHKNKSAPWADKATALRLVTDALSACGTDTAILWHEEENRDQDGRLSSHQTLSKMDRARILRCLNAVIRLDYRSTGRVACLVWSRNGPRGIEFEDTEGYWRGVPERIDAAIRDFNTHSGSETLRSPTRGV